MIATPTVLKLIEINTDKEISVKFENELEDNDDALKLFFVSTSTINLVFIDVYSSSKITSTNKNFIANLYDEIFIPPPEIV